MQSHLVAGKMVPRADSSAARIRRRSTAFRRRGGRRLSHGIHPLLNDLRGNSSFWRGLSFLNLPQQEQSTSNIVVEENGDECSVIEEGSKEMDSSRLSYPGSILADLKQNSITERMDTSSSHFGDSSHSRNSRRRTTSPVDNEELEALVNSIIDKRFEEEEMALLKEEEEEEKDDQEWHSPFAENIYTLMYMCAFQSYAFWYALFIYAIQMTTITLTLVDVVEYGAKDGNPLGIPPMVDITVTCAQAICLILVLAYQSDFIEALLKLQDGFYPEVLKEHPGATYETWLLSCITQLVAGLMFITIMFVLTMQVEQVLSVMMNFAALHFMAEIDDIGFALARLGFIRIQLQKEAEACVDFQVPLRRRRNLTRQGLYLLALAGFFTGYGIIKKKQLNGQYLQTYIYVQFGNQHQPAISYYSGVFESTIKRTTGRRSYRDTATGTMLLSYCSTDHAWTFSWAADNDPCTYFATSLGTKTFDVSSIPDSEWMIKDPKGRIQPFDSFSLAGRDCDPIKCQGQCVGGVCQCTDDSFGMDCDHSHVCPELGTDKRFPAFPVLTNANWGEEESKWAGGVSDSFELLKNLISRKLVKVNNMPVYYSTKTYPANIIFFGGHHWVLTTEWDLFDLAQARKESPSRRFFPELTVATLENNFHGHYQANYIPLFFSDPVNFATPNYLPTPAGLGWWSVKKSQKDRDFTPDRLLDTSLTCKTCNLDNGGCNSLGGYCDQSSGQCVCHPGYTGDKCEFQRDCYEEDNPCNGVGTCDEVSGSCICQLPYYGKHCDYHHKCYEEYGSCSLGGTCNYTSGDCNCEDPALFGKTCNKKADCHTLGCSNGGICGARGDCVCRPPFTGQLCDLVDATQEDKYFCYKDEDCNGGACELETGICSCGDPNAIAGDGVVKQKLELIIIGEPEASSKFGSLCEHQFNCSEPWFNCVNGGKCDGSNGVCDCPNPYFGPDCSKTPRCYKTADCGGEPNQCDLDSGLCHCINGPAAGRLCEIDIAHSCAISGCANGGSCSISGICECPRPYTGAFCEALIGDLPPSGIVDGLQLTLQNCLQKSEWTFPPNVSDPNCKDVLESSIYGDSYSSVVIP